MAGRAWPAGARHGAVPCVGARWLRDAAIRGARRRRAPDNLARNDTALLQRAALALLAGEGGGQGNAVMATLGLDELSVRQTENAQVSDTSAQVWAATCR